MAISFDNVPSTLRVPFVAIEIDNTNAIQGPVVKPYKLLLIGQRTTAGTVAKEVPTRVTSAAQAKTYFGQGSMLAQMCAASINANNFTETWACALDDDAGGVKATQTLTVTGPATAAGTIYLYVGGTRLTVAVAASDTANDIAAAIDAACDANLDLPMVATSATNVVTLTAVHKGEAGNKIDVRLNYYAGEALPAGVAIAIAAGVTGTTNPDMSNLIAALGDVQYDHIAMPYVDSNSFVDIEAEMLSRFGPLRPLEGMVTTADNSNHTDLSTLGNSRNSSFVTIEPCYDSPTLVWEVASISAAVKAYYGNIDPARQFRGLALTGMLPPPVASRFTIAEQNLHLYDGVSTNYVDAGGVVRIGRSITTYKQNSVGADDPSYLDVVTPMLLGYLRYDFRNMILLKYPRHKLADDGTRFGSGQPIVTPKTLKGELLSKFREWEVLGYVENFEQFKRDLIVERNITDPNRVDMTLPVDLINNAMVFGAKMNFLLQGSSL